ncbi:hypothetical protein ACWF8U_04630 [Streptomyces olivaceus]|uniref:hypothetical protein n=1 Tax=Streptomyces TaxID=1883 RepID=UPI0018F871E3|nr:MULTISPECIES: hypothetical protein [Streptomyces]MBZ6127719.1 hypothetical protein [Streptomyces olivaceus]MBZ6215215.1 hypothetical protein [Streptomyces olivaceus]MBZ6224793.1 hypothetical protein [Streptomyces olivaceus]MBZ6245511.1 hypothetical protein [Streptomyces olivaceus]MBZ6265054.1 hypothetical protein [Streptomyces olivaceus]
MEGQPATPTRPQDAVRALPRPAVGEPKGVARQGVVTALPRTNRFTTDPRPDTDPTPDRPGIRIYAPPVYRHHYDGARWSTRHNTTPTAAYACPCGQTRTARGQDAVTNLTADYRCTDP